MAVENTQLSPYQFRVRVLIILNTKDMANSKYIEELKKLTIRNNYGTYKYGDYVVAHCINNGRWVNILGTITDIVALSEWNGFVTLGYGLDRFYVDFCTLRPYKKKTA